MPVGLLSQDFWGFAARYIALDTQPETGNAAVEGFVYDLLAPLQARFTVQRAVHLGKPQVNVLASFGPQKPGGLLLLTHADTVPMGPIARWTEGAPLQLTRTGDGRVIGLGVVDVKLDFICKAFALRGLNLRRLHKPVHLLATYGEELGLIGSKAFIASGVLKPEWVLCGEPSELIPCHAHKGYAMSELRARLAPAPMLRGNQRYVVQGKAAHSSTPDLGVNAIEKLLATVMDTPVLAVSGGSSSNTVPAEAHAVLSAARPGSVDDTQLFAPDLRPALQALQSAWAIWTRLCKALTPISDPEFSPADVVCNFGVLRQDAECLIATFDARLLPQHDPENLHSGFAQALATLVPAGVTLSASSERAARGMRAPADSPLLQALTAAVVALGLPPGPRAKATSTEAGAFFHAGADALVFGPGVSIGNAHAANEWNRESDLAAAIAIYRRVIAALCL